MKSMTVKLLLSLSLALLTLNHSAYDKTKVSKSLDGAAVTILSPKNGAVITGDVVVKFGIKGMDVAPAGSDKVNSGHHHLLIDGTKMPESGMPMGNNVKHFGGGQTETTLTLSKGKHTLQLILGDKSHVPHHEMIVSEIITITVQ